MAPDAPPSADYAPAPPKREGLAALNRKQRRQIGALQRKHRRAEAARKRRDPSACVCNKPDCVACVQAARAFLAGGSA